MPNYVSVDLVITGKEENIKRMFKDIEECMDTNKVEYPETDAGYTGLLVAKHYNLEKKEKYSNILQGIMNWSVYHNVPDPDNTIPLAELQDDRYNVNIRSFMKTFEMGEDAEGNAIIRIHSLDIWNTATSLYSVLEKIYDVKIIYKSEEAGLGVLLTNDSEGNFFPESYYVEVEEPDDEHPELELSDYILTPNTVEEIWVHFRVANELELREKYEVICFGTYELVDLPESRLLEPEEVRAIIERVNK